VSIKEPSVASVNLSRNCDEPDFLSPMSTLYLYEGKAVVLIMNAGFGSTKVS
jgi:hypothetical protein